MLILGGQASGVSFHVHGPGFSETLIGGKRWFLFPPALSALAYNFGEHGPNTTALAWLQSQYPQIMNASSHSCSPSDACSLEPEQTDGQMQLRELGEQLQECSLVPGQLLYFPAMWPHATLNTAPYNAFVSIFIDPQLMRS